MKSLKEVVVFPIKDSKENYDKYLRKLGYG